MKPIAGAVLGIATVAAMSGSVSAQTVVETAVEAPASGAPALRLGDVPHTPDEPKIDGILDEALWRQALVIRLDIETQPRENGPAPVETFVHMIENGTTLLIAFDARDPEPEAIRAYLRDRDSAYNDDFVGVVLDTFNDQRRAFEFFTNPLGVQMDLTFDDVNGREDDSWDAIWDSAGVIGEQGFTVEIAIPFSQLRFQNSDSPQTWGLDALRFYPRADRVRISANRMDRGRNCYLCQLGKIEGFAAAEPGRGLEVVPAVTASRTDERDATANDLVAGDADGELGVNVRWGITPDLIANLALNPDFSQVEADVPQLDVNNQFALYFPETRPFFLEGADFFSTPLEAVFTRTVADPDIGAKLTGTRNSNTFGVFVAEDAVTNLLFPGALSSANDSLAQSNETIVGRYQRAFGSNSTVGALATARAGDDYHNRVAGFDGRYRPNDTHSIRFQALRSDTDYPTAVATEHSQPQDAFTGDAVEVGYDYGTREWWAFANYQNLDSSFRADSGFISQVDVVVQSAGFGRTWHGDGSRWWNQLRVGANANTSDDTAGRLLRRNRTVWAGLNGPRQLYAETGFNTSQQFWNGVLYDLKGIFLYSQARPVSGLSLSLQGRSGGQIDFANSRLGEELRLQPSVEWNANRHLLVRIRYTFSQLDADDSGARIFDAELTDVRFTWQFNVRAFLRLTAQQQVIERNLALFTNPNTDALSKTRGMQLLYSYQLNPQTVIYAGYSDNHLQDDDLATLTQTERTFFLKFSYAWVP
jgi:hypothetical protein